jgi:hypothetical protein
VALAQWHAERSYAAALTYFLFFDVVSTSDETYSPEMTGLYVNIELERK